jgi:16S rRNA G966 N2-methylase RsmD
MVELIVNPRFKELIPPLSPEERQQLEDNVARDGCRDPVVRWKQTLIDGHNRYEICTRRKIPFQTQEIDFSDEDAACIWIIRNQFGRRNLTTFARAELALKLEPLLKPKAEANQKAGGEKAGRGRPAEQGSAILPKPIATIDVRKETAKAAGVSPRTITTVKYIQANADEETKQKLRTQPDMKVHRVAKDLKEKQQRETRQAKRTEAAKDAPNEDDRIITGDFRKHGDKIPNGSLSLIFTDPPYDRKASSMLPDLGAFAKSKLADGGSLLLYVGQTQLPSALDALRPHLRYWWTVACVHAGRSTVMREYGINAGWKAVLWFVKGTRDNSSEMVRDVMSGGEEKTHHDWQQAESEAAYWIKALCPANGIVCDPFLGGGTTAAAAEKLSRKWIGFEIDEANAAIARGRVKGI